VPDQHRRLLDAVILGDEAAVLEELESHIREFVVIDRQPDVRE